MDKTAFSYVKLRVKVPKQLWFYYIYNGRRHLYRSLSLIKILSKKSTSNATTKCKVI